MNKKIIASIQILPLKDDKKDRYDIIDRVIDMIRKSGLKYFVSPFETAIEGTYDEVSGLLDKIHRTIMNENAGIISNVRIIFGKDEDITIDEKMTKYI